MAVGHGLIPSPELGPNHRRPQVRVGFSVQWASRDFCDRVGRQGARNVCRVNDLPAKSEKFRSDPV